MASLRKEGKFYKIYYWVGGKQYKRSLRTGSKQQAERIKLQIENDMVAGLFNLEKYSPHLQKNLSEFITEAIEYAKTIKSPSTAVREARVLNNFLRYLGDVRLSSISIKLIESYKTFLKTEKEFNLNGINIELRHLSAAFSLAVKYNYISKNPFKEVSKVKVPKKHPIYLTRDQADKLLEITKGKSVYQHILIALCTGARISEIVNLEWENVDFNNSIIKLHGKGAKDRIVPIPEILKNFLMENKKKSGMVCNGTKLPDQVSRNFRKYADQLGLNGFTFHNLRDTYASWLVQNRVNLTVIKELLGHEDIKTTLLYAHLAPDNRFDAMRVIDKVLNK